MELLALLGVALFLIIVSAVMFMIFGGGDIGTVTMMIIGVVITCAIGLGVFMTIATIFPQTNNGGTIDNSAPRGLFSARSFIEVTNITICSNFTAQTPEPCSGPGIQSVNDIVLYWQTPNSVGCCATYGCLYPAFEEACLKPFRLYNLYLDDIKEDMDAQMADYVYTCSYAMPWNWHTFYNISEGQHTLRVEQKNCVDIVATAEITFTITFEDGRYVVREIQ